MQLENYYYYFKSVLTPETCKKIIDLGLSEMEKTKSRGEMVEAYTGGGTEKSNMPGAIPAGEKLRKDLQGQHVYDRDSKVSWLNDQWLYDTILPYVDKANQYAGWRYNYDYCESFQFTVYEPDGFYNWHRDGGSDHYAKYKRYIEGISPPRPSNRKDRLPPGYVKNNQLFFGDSAIASSDSTVTIINDGQLGNDFNLNGNDITGSGNILITGSIEVTSSVDYSGNIIAYGPSSAFTGSLFGSSSYALTASFVESAS